MSAVFLALKDLRLLLRDRVALFWVFGFPLMFALFIGAVIRGGLHGDTGPLKLAVVDQSKSKSSARIVAQLEKHPRLDVTLTSSEAARQAVRLAQAAAYFELPNNYTTHPASSARPELGFDPARELEVAYLEQLLLGALDREAGGMKPPLPRSRIDHKILATGSSVPRSASDIVFPSAILWGLLGCTACFAISLVAERTRGTYVRLRALPLSRHTLLAGKALSSLIASLLVAALLTLIGVIGFDVHISSGFKFSLALITAALCFCGITMGLSVLGKTEQAVAGAGWATLLVMAMLGGGMVPLSMMPEWLANISDISPVKWGILALEGATWRSFSLPELALPCGVLLGVGALSFLAGALLLAKAEG